MRRLERFGDSGFDKRVYERLAQVVLRSPYWHSLARINPRLFDRRAQWPEQMQRSDAPRLMKRESPRFLGTDPKTGDVDLVGDTARG